MGRYCKAYQVKRLREFSGWSENLENLRKDRRKGESQTTTEVLSDDDYLYLQENFVVTDGVFIDENIIFDQVTPEWRDYAANILKFEVPKYQVARSADVDAGSEKTQ